MQNRSAIWIFTVLLTLACLYQLSFSYFTNSFEKEAESNANVQLQALVTENPEMSGAEQDSAKNILVEKYLKDHETDKVYPWLGYTYQQCKDREMVFGLDLQGGMSVALDISIYDLVKNLAAQEASDSTFQKALDLAFKTQISSHDDFVTAFGKAWNEVAGKDSQKMAIIFHLGNKDIFPDPNISNDEVLALLSDRAKAAIDNTENILSNRINKFGVSQPTIEKQELSGRIFIDLPGVKDKERVRKLLQSTANLEFWDTYQNFEIFPYLQEGDSLLCDFLYPGLIDESVLFDSTLTKKDTTLLDTNSNNIVKDTTSKKDTSNEITFDDLNNNGSVHDSTDTLANNLENDNVDKRKKYPIFSRLNLALFTNEQGSQQWQTGSVIGYASVADTADLNNYFKERVVAAAVPGDLNLLWGNKPDDHYGNLIPLYCIKKATADGKPLLDGGYITDAGFDFDQYTGAAKVLMQMDNDGSEIWRNMTKEASSTDPKSCVAIVLDNYVYSAPTVQGEIGGGRSEITGNFTQIEAQDLSNILKAGALPAPAEIIDESVVGPTLGQKNINAGLWSVVIAMIFVLIYMVFYYAKAGLVADVALISNIFFIMGTLASLQASLTLAGIAGIVLTIGMSVDANVLIYERIREEMRAGKGMRLAITDGYKAAYSAIIDANVTTILTAIVLIWFGSGTIESFATTLIIGILSSLFSSIFITRLIFTKMLEKKGATISFHTKLTENIFTKTNIQWVQKRKVYYLISGIIITAGIVSLFVRGLDLGIEFVGGRTYMVEFHNGKPADISQIKQELGNVFVDEKGIKQFPEVKIIDNEFQVKITTKHMIDANSNLINVDSVVEARLHQGLGTVVGQETVNGINPLYELEESRKVDKSISNDIMYSSVGAVLFAFFIMFLYIVFRFRKWQYGLGAIIATFHDALVVIGLFSIFYGILPFTMEIDQAFIAAILTVVGYSINDTVVIFDRIREYIGLYNKKDETEIINSALNSTLSRTVNTSLTTFIVLLTIFIFGGEAIRGFSFALMIGVVVGTYSSLCIATPVVVDLSKSLRRLKRIKK